MLKNHAWSRASSIAQIASLLFSATASAATIYWDGTGTAWNSVISWSTASNATTPNPAAVPGVSDIAFFNITTVNSNQTVNLNAAEAASGLVFSSTGTTLLQTGAGSNTLTLGANGISIAATAGADTISANVALSAAQSWTNNSVSNFSLSGNLALGANALTYAGPGNATITGIISGSGGITKSGAGTLTLQGNVNNSYTGNTVVNDGTLALAMSYPAYAFSGNLTIGDGVGAPASAVVNMVQIRQFSFNSAPNVTINTDGALTLNSSDETINNIVMTGGSISNTFNFFYNEGNFTTNANAASATVSGTKMFLYGSNAQIHTFAVADGAAQYDLDFSAGIDGATYNSFLTKEGPGTMRISGNSAFSTLTLANGTLYLTGNNTFTGPINVNYNTSLFVANQSLGVVTFAPGVYAFLNVASANAAVGGLQTDMINPGSAYVTNPQLFPAILTIANNANNTFAGNIYDGNASLGITKAGTATLTLTGYLTFSLPLTINAGTLVLSVAHFSADVINNATFIYNSGPFPGRLTNAGTTILNIDLTAGNGLENDATFNVNSGRTVTLNGLGLDNEGTLNMSGGTLFLSTDGSANNINRGTFNLYSALPLSLNGATLTNNGTLNLNTGLVIGATGLLNNGPGGTINGPGAITSPFSNSGGVIAVANGTINITQPFANAGGILLSSNSATLSGGNITNTGFIRGIGNVGNNITNNGTIEPLGGGTLLIGGSLTNSGAGILRSSTGNQLIILQGLTTNAGAISLTGGTFDNNNHPLNNTGQITGYGTFSTGGGGLTNNGTLTLTGTNGNTTTVNGDVTNAAGKTINVKFNPAIFTGNITNNGTIKTTSTTVTFTGNYTGNTYLSDPATNIFQGSATTVPGGLMTGSTGDVFNFAGGTFTNNGTFQNGGTLQVATGIVNTATFTQSGPQTWSTGATFTNNSGTATFQSNAKLYGLAITGGTVDITNSKFIIEPTNKSTTLTALQSNIAAHSLIASGIPANFGLALIDNALLNKSTFGGNPADSNSLLLSEELLGDTNIDGHVDATDLSTILNNFGTTTPAWTSGNFDHAPTIDLTDLAAVLNNFGLTNSNAFAAPSQTSLLDGGSPAAPVPEPATLALSLLAIPFLTTRGQRPRQSPSSRSGSPFAIPSKSV